MPTQALARRRCHTWACRERRQQHPQGRGAVGRESKGSFDGVERSSSIDGEKKKKRKTRKTFLQMKSTDDEDGGSAQRSSTLASLSEADGTSSDTQSTSLLGEGSEDKPKGKRTSMISSVAKLPGKVVTKVGDTISSVPVPSVPSMPSLPSMPMAQMRVFSVSRTIYTI